MPWGRYPSRVKEFNKWARGRVETAELSDSATPSKKGFRGTRWRRRRRRHKKRRTNDA